MNRQTLIYFVLGIFLALSLLGWAQQTNQTSAPLGPADESFLRVAAQTQGQVELAQAGLKSPREDVRKFAKMVLDDLTKTGADLRNVAAKQGIAVPPANVPPVMMQMFENYKQGLMTSPWNHRSDQSFVSMMLHEFTTIVEEYGREANRQAPTNAALKSYAQKMWPVLQKDVASGKQLAAQLGVPQ